MSEYKESYCKLFSGITSILQEMKNDAENPQLQTYISRLKELQQESEEIFISASEK